MNIITPSKPQIEIDQELKVLLLQETERCTIMHCSLYTDEETMVRIWPNTFLVQDTGGRSKLIKAFNISIQPYWTYHPFTNGIIQFTLVFEGLDKGCSNFALLEDIPEPNGFYTSSVARNKSDVYRVDVYS